MLFEDTYKTLDAPSEGVFRDKGSKFIAYAFPFKREEDLKDILNNIKKEHPKARHHCYAWRLTQDKAIYRINDDGEPSGTAGRPILNVLLSNELTNVLVIVVRYFGGTLLGVPGLINAYKEVTQDAISQALIVERTVNDVYQLHFDYLQMNDVMRVIKEENLTPENQQFDLQCQLEISVRKKDVNRVTEKIQDIDGVILKYIGTH